MFKKIIKKIIKKIMASINVNDVFHSGHNIVITNGQVIIDGKDVTPDSKNISISIQGDVETLDVGACNRLVVHGNVGKLKTSSGDVHVDGDVYDGITTTSGDIKCLDIKGNINTTSGDVECKGSISGSVKTLSGDISYQ